MKGWTYLFISILLSLILMGSQARSQTDQQLWETLRTLGIHVDRTVYHHGSRVSHRILTSQLDQLAKQLAMTLQIAPIQKRVEFDGVRYEAKGTHNNLTTTLTIVNDQPTQQWSKPYISIRVSQQGVNRYYSTEAWLKRVLTKFQLQPKVDCTVQGSMPHYALTLEQPVVAVLTQLSAVEVEAIRTKQVVSISAWSPRLSGSLSTRGGRMNIQAAAKLDEQTDQLLVTIGSPIITVEY